MSHIIIEDKKTLDLTREAIANGDSTILSGIFLNANPEITLSEIGEKWQKNYDGRAIWADTFNYMIHALALKRVEHYEYLRLINGYSSNIETLYVDDIYEKSIEILSKVGYIF